jgi:hypothetical protein
MKRFLYKKKYSNLKIKDTVIIEKYLTDTVYVVLKQSGKWLRYPQKR